MKSLLAFALLLALVAPAIGATPAQPHAAPAPPPARALQLEHLGPGYWLALHPEIDRGDLQLVAIRAAYRGHASALRSQGTTKQIAGGLLGMLGGVLLAYDGGGTAADLAGGLWIAGAATLVLVGTHDVMAANRLDAWAEALEP